MENSGMESLQSKRSPTRVTGSSEGLMPTHGWRRPDAVYESLPAPQNCPYQGYFDPEPDLLASGAGKTNNLKM
ncbi:hypothetical protein MnBA_41310 [Marinobacterium sp. BA1]